MIRAFAVLVVITLAPSAASADEAPGSPISLPKLFPQRADVFVERPGISRLPLPAGVLTACRADLSDVRLLDRSGREIAFLVDTGLEAGKRWTVMRSLDASPRNAQREELRRENGPPLHRERYEVIAPPAAKDQRWTLVFNTSRPSFVRHVTIATIAADGSATTHVDESIFRLTANGAAREKLTLVVPETTSERLLVTLEGEDGSYLEPSLRFETASSLAASEQLVIPLRELSRQSADGHTLVELSRPRGLVADVLRVETATPWFDRAVTVGDEGPGTAGAPLGAGRLFRVQGVSAADAPQQLTLRPAVGDRIVVDVTDGDSPPLDKLGFSVVIRQPALVFALSETTPDVAAATLYFGGGRAYRPRYDLASMPTGAVPVGGQRAEVASYLRNLDAVGVARLGEIQSNTAFDGSMALGFAMRPGAAVDPRLYSHRRPLAITPSNDGLSRVQLTAEELALTREDLGDVRVVDESDRQWPYLVEQRAARIDVPLAVKGPIGTNPSRYSLELPVPELAPEQLTLETDASFLDRPYRLNATVDVGGERQETQLAAANLVRRALDRGPLKIAAPGRRVRSLELSISDGNEAPLSFSSVRAQISVPELFVAAPPGRYSLLIGNPGEAPPRYELAQVRDVVLALDGAAVPPAALEKNPQYSMGARLRSGSGPQKIALWIALAAAVVTLAFVTLRLAREPNG
jgi:hypothetical protein